MMTRALIIAASLLLAGTLFFFGSPNGAHWLGAIFVAIFGVAVAVNKPSR